LAADGLVLEIVGEGVKQAEKPGAQKDQQERNPGGGGESGDSFPPNPGLRPLQDPLDSEKTPQDFFRSPARQTTRHIPG